LVMQFLWKYIDDLVGKGLDLITVGHLLFYMSATMVPLALPLAILLSSIMTFGNLGESFELVALKSSGISLTRFMRPLIFTSLIISILAFLFSNYMIPWANLQANSLLYDIVNLKHGFRLKDGEFFNEIEGYSIRVGKTDPDGVTIHQVLIYDRTIGTNDNLILAKSGKMEQSPDKKFVFFILKNGWQYEERGQGASVQNEFIRIGFKKFRKVFDLSSFKMIRTNKNLFKDNYRMLDLRQLNFSIDSIGREAKMSLLEMPAFTASRFAFQDWKDTGWLKQPVPALKARNFYSCIPDSVKRFVLDRTEMNLRAGMPQLKNTVLAYDDVETQLRRFEIEWQRKFTLSFACMVLFLIGAPLGSIIRKGGLGTPLVFAVAFFVVFNVVSTIGEKLAVKGVMTPFGGMWLATIVLVPIACFLVYKALNDSQLFNQEFYYRSFKRFRQMIKQKKQA
ncbi:MAG: LptF/LptG family permease, partial [Chitinophagaceae bacterium]